MEAGSADGQAGTVSTSSSSSSAAGPNAAAEDVGAEADIESPVERAQEEQEDAADAVAAQPQTVEQQRQTPREEEEPEDALPEAAAIGEVLQAEVEAARAAGFRAPPTADGGAVRGLLWSTPSLFQLMEHSGGLTDRVAQELGDGGLEELEVDLEEGAILRTYTNEDDASLVMFPEDEHHRSSVRERGGGDEFPVRRSAYVRRFTTGEDLRRPDRSEILGMGVSSVEMRVPAAGPPRILPMPPATPAMLESPDRSVWEDWSLLSPEWPTLPAIPIPPMQRPVAWGDRPARMGVPPLGESLNPALLSAEMSTPATVPSPAEPPGVGRGAPRSASNILADALEEAARRAGSRPLEAQLGGGGADDASVQFQCPICLDICEDAIETPCCYHLFCETCLLNDAHRIDKCPICKSRLLRSQLRPNYPVRRLVAEMPCECRFQGCRKSLRRLNRRAHEETCEHQPVRCRWSTECKDLVRWQLAEHEAEECPHRRILCAEGCGEWVHFAGIQEHLTTSCKNRPCKCEYCGTDMLRRNLPAHMADDCECAPVHCGLKEAETQESCDHQCERRLLPEHRRLCPFRVALCSHPGCGAATTHRRLEEHQQNCNWRVINCQKCQKEVSLGRLQLHLEDECPEHVIPCPLAGYGCDTRIQRRLLADHCQRAAVQHVQLLVNAMEARDAEMASMRMDWAEKVNEMCGKNLQLEQRLQALEHRNIHHFSFSDYEFRDRRPDSYYPRPRPTMHPQSRPMPSGPRAAPGRPVGGRSAHFERLTHMYPERVGVMSMGPPDDMDDSHFRINTEDWPDWGSSSRPLPPAPDEIGRPTILPHIPHPISPRIPRSAARVARAGLVPPTPPSIPHEPSRLRASAHHSAAAAELPLPPFPPPSPAPTFSSLLAAVRSGSAPAEGPALIREEGARGDGPWSNQPTSHSLLGGAGAFALPSQLRQAVPMPMSQLREGEWPMWSSDDSDEVFFAFRRPAPRPRGDSAPLDLDPEGQRGSEDDSDPDSARSRRDSTPELWDMSSLVAHAESEQAAASPPHSSSPHLGISLPLRSPPSHLITMNSGGISGGGSGPAASFHRTPPTRLLQNTMPPPPPVPPVPQAGLLAGSAVVAAADVSSPTAARASASMVMSPSASARTFAEAAGVAVAEVGRAEAAPLSDAEEEAQERRVPATHAGMIGTAGGGPRPRDSVGPNLLSQALGPRLGVPGPAREAHPDVDEGCQQQ
eukprot:TRINITY_DN101536_c0_g1_i1.p1 TRINITY_DN101536_c0_g1~~TRINITY_DN101536_c0_g1_i1.p1  ORF type:complete len:1217 (+),score=234.24 TRINITY_DN101536_c0_g1_i1:87-3737(+)